MDIRDYIPEYPGKIDRFELMDRTGLTDRKNRALIAKAVTEGTPICNLGEGYFITYDSEIMKRQAKVHWARIKSELARAKAFGENIQLIESIERHFELIGGCYENKGNDA